MANPIIECVNATNLNVYVFEVNRLTGQVWNVNASAFQVWNPAIWAQFAVALTELSGSGYYWAARPAGVAGSLVTDVPYVRAGGSPASGDAPPFNLLHGEGENVAAINGDAAVAPQLLQENLATGAAGVVAAGTITNTSFPSNFTGYANNVIVGRTLVFGPSTANPRGAVAILAYNGSTGLFTVAPLVGAPSVGDAFNIV